MDRLVVRDEMERARLTFHCLLDSATVAELSRPSKGTKWTKWAVAVPHALRLPDRRAAHGSGPDLRPAARRRQPCVRALEASTTPFHVINYIGSVGGPRLLGYEGMGQRFDRAIDKLTRHLDRESDSELSRGMHYPTSWDPYFKAYMTLADIYRYPTQHFEHHRRQLTLDAHS